MGLVTDLFKMSCWRKLWKHDALSYHIILFYFCQHSLTTFQYIFLSSHVTCLLHHWTSHCRWWLTHFHNLYFKISALQFLYSNQVTHWKHHLLKAPNTTFTLMSLFIFDLITSLLILFSITHIHNISNHLSTYSMSTFFYCPTNIILRQYPIYRNFFFPLVFFFKRNFCFQYKKLQKNMAFIT